MKSILSNETNFKVRYLIKQSLKNRNQVNAEYKKNDYPEKSSFKGYSIYINNEWVDGCKRESLANSKIEYIKGMIEELQFAVQ
jgi:hypothetical protein